MSADRNGEILEASPTTVERIRFTFFVVALWFVTSWFELVSPLLLPSPISVIGAALNIGWPLAWHALATTARTLVGFLIGFGIGVLLGLATRYSRMAKLTLEPLFDASRPVPAIALVPFFILIFGFSEAGRVVLVATSVAIILAVAAAEATEAMPESWFRFPLVAGFSRRQIFYRIVVPAIVPWLRGPLRIALSLSFTLVIASEFMGAQQGLGYLINISRVNLATHTILLCVLMLGGIAQILDSMLNGTIMRLSFWYQGTRSVLKKEA